MRVRRNQRQVLFRNRDRRNGLRFFDHRADIIRSRAAASARDADTFFQKFSDRLGKLRRENVIYSLSVFGSRKTRVRLKKNRYGSIFEILFHHADKLVRTERAVRSDRIGMHALEHRDHRGRGCTGHEFSVRAVGIGNKHRKIRILFDRKERGLRIVAVIHGLDEHKIDAGSHTKFYGLTVHRDRVVKFIITIRFQEFS